MKEENIQKGNKSMGLIHILIINFFVTSLTVFLMTYCSCDVPSYEPDDFPEPVDEDVYPFEYEDHYQEEELPEMEPYTI